MKFNFSLNVIKLFNKYEIIKLLQYPNINAILFDNIFENKYENITPLKVFTMPTAVNTANFFIFL